LSWNSSDDEDVDEQTKGREESEGDKTGESDDGSDDGNDDDNDETGRGLQVTQNIKDSHVTLTPVHPDGPQESSSVSSFVTSMLNPISDAG
nr:hypothetical protein [Tanacetum cinerariifolium]